MTTKQPAEGSGQSVVPKSPVKGGKAKTAVLQQLPEATLDAKAAPPTPGDRGSSGTPSVMFSAPAMAEIERLDVNSALPRWLERFDILAGLHGWTTRAQAQVLLMRLTPALYDNLADSVAPVSLVDMTVEELRQALQTLLQPCSYVLAERFNFQNLRKEASESVRAYAERIIRASEKCLFTDSEERMRDQFICGLGDRAVVAKLLARDHRELTFRTAWAEAEAQVSLRDSHILKSATGGRAEPVMALMQGLRGPRRKQPEQADHRRPPDPDGSRSIMGRGRKSGGTLSGCPGCGGPRHSKADCPATGKICRACGKMNHFQRQCRARAPPTSNKARQHWVAEEQQPGQQSQILAVGQRGEPPTRSDGFLFELQCECVGRRHALKGQLDTGAAVSVLPSRLWRDWGRPRLHSAKAELTGYALGHRFRTLGSLPVRLIWQQRNVRTIFYVVESDRQFALLGRNVLQVDRDAITIGQLTVCDQQRKSGAMQTCSRHPCPSRKGRYRVT